LAAAIVVGVTSCNAPFAGYIDHQPRRNDIHHVVIARLSTRRSLERAI
jgi:hypothetical protein